LDFIIYWLFKVAILKILSMLQKPYILTLENVKTASNPSYSGSRNQEAS
jgi:hypothetical protein